MSLAASFGSGYGLIDLKPDVVVGENDDVAETTTRCDHITLKLWESIAVCLIMIDYLMRLGVG